MFASGPVWGTLFAVRFIWKRPRETGCPFVERSPGASGLLLLSAWQICAAEAALLPMQVCPRLATVQFPLVGIEQVPPEEVVLEVEGEVFEVEGVVLAGLFATT